jgi:hypothetical protein
MPNAVASTTNKRNKIEMRTTPIVAMQYKWRKLLWTSKRSNPSSVPKPVELEAIVVRL